MNRKICIVMVLLVLTVSYSTQAAAEPGYAKWGRLAMKEAMKRYHADIVDYKHIGRRTEQSGVITESFRLIVREGSRQFDVIVRIQFDRNTERVIRIQFVEDDKAGKRPTFTK